MKRHKVSYMSCGELRRVLYRDLARRPLIEILYRDLARTPLMEILYGDVA